MCRAEEGLQTDLGPCQCEVLLRFGLPCRHHLQPFYHSGAPIPRSLCHPRWWLYGPQITFISWAPYSDWQVLNRRIVAPQLSDGDQRLQRLREAMDPENRHRFNSQITRRQQEVDEDLVRLGERRLQLQSLPIGQPDPVPKRSWLRKGHGKASARAPTANEAGERRQRQEALQQAEITRIRLIGQDETQITEQEEAQIVHSPKPFNSQFSTISVAPRPLPIATARSIPLPMAEAIQISMRAPSSRVSMSPPPSTLEAQHSDHSPDHSPNNLPSTPPPITQLPIRTPTTAERPRWRRTPSPELSPEPIYELPVSTAPPKLGREKRKRVHTARYQEARNQGLIDESQEAHKAI